MAKTTFENIEEVFEGFAQDAPVTITTEDDGRGQTEYQGAVSVDVRMVETATGSGCHTLKWSQKEDPFDAYLHGNFHGDEQQHEVTGTVTAATFTLCLNEDGEEYWNVEADITWSVE